MHAVVWVGWKIRAKAKFDVALLQNRTMMKQSAIFESCIRCLGLLGLVAVICGQALAQTNTPPDPQDLNQALRDAANAALGAERPAADGSSLATPYASDSIELEVQGSPFNDGNLHLAAKLVAETPPLTTGLAWRVFGTKPDETGTLPLIATAAGGSTSFDLKPGNYLIHVAYGRAGATLRVNLGETTRYETIVLDAGGMRLSGAAGRRSGEDLEGLTFDIYARRGSDADRLELIAADVEPDNIVPVKAGIYHVVSKYGQVNAVVRADVAVEPNRLTEMTAYHKAARLNFRLVAAEGGDALASTMWSILTPGGDTVAESVGAVPEFVLAEGEYVAVAQHNESVYNRSFSVEAGFDRNVEVVAITSPSQLTLSEEEFQSTEEVEEEENTVTFEQLDVDGETTDEVTEFQ